MNDVKHFEDGPGSLLSMTTDRLSEAIQRVPPDLIDMEDYQLAEMMPYKKFGSVDTKIRVSFWKEYERAILKNSKMKVVNVYDGICTTRYFYEFFLKDKVRCAYMLRPVPKDEKAFDEAGFLATEKLRELILMPYMEGGKVDAKAAAVVLKAVELALNRSKGAVLQVIHQKNLNVNMNADVTADSTPRSIEDIDRELALLEKKRTDILIQAPDAIEIGHIELKDPNE